ncbi:hypothetical protein J4219_06775 [Candidatus Woesearchaeota archaeon]|nr:hypothetical protein [Candidatus Woesearchaeota archaeon]
MIALLILLPALTIADYPSFLFDNSTYAGMIIVSDIKEPAEAIAVNTILNSLPTYAIPTKSKYRDDTIRATPKQLLESIHKSSTIEHITTPTLIIGTTCANKWADLLIPSTTCEIFKQQEAVISTHTINSHPVILITATNASMVQEATSYLHNSKSQLAAQQIHILKGTYAYSSRGDAEPLASNISKINRDLQEYRQTPYKKYGQVIRNLHSDRIQPPYPILN